MDYKKHLHTGAVLLCGILVLAVVAITEAPAGLIQTFTTKDFTNAAAKYLQNSEKTGTPITIRDGKKYYYYVPMEPFSGTFPGIMLDSKTKPITDENILKELYRYPGLINEFSSSVKDFNKLASEKTVALSKYCKILKVQKIRFDELNTQGNVVGALYYGIKLANDAVGLVHSSVTGMAALIKDLAKGSIQDSILSYLTDGGSSAILENTQKAYDASVKAYNSCETARKAWNYLVSTSGKVSPAYALNATKEVASMYLNEKTAITELKQALDRINTYPKIVTKIGKNDYKNGISGMQKVIDQLKVEEESWSEMLNNANDDYFISLWILEQKDRTGTESQVQESKGPVCSSLDLASDYTIYTYTPTSGNGPCKNFANNASSKTVSLSCATSNRFRNHWVKRISTDGKSTIRIKANLTIDDSGFFYSMCPYGGVKYDDYSSLLVVSQDPRPTFDTECNKVCSDADWPKCSISADSSQVLAKCGVLKCSPSQTCDMEAAVTGLSDIYLVFHTSNPWPAYVTGTMSNVEICK